MSKPTVNPKRTTINGGSITDASLTAAKMGSASIVGPKIGTAAVGLTQAASAIKRQLTVVPLGNTLATAFNSVVFRAPPQGATITAAYVCPGSIQNHAVNESDTWIFTLQKYSATIKTGLSKNAPSLSNQTLAATAFRSLPINNGAATLVSGNRLRLEASISGTPAALQWPCVAIEWIPYTNA